MGHSVSTPWRIGLALLGLAAALMAVSVEQATAAKAKITLARAKPVRVVPIEINRYAYTDRVELSCRGKSTPLMAGWSTPEGSVGSVYIDTYSDETTLGLMMVAPARAGSFKGSVTCLNRSLKTSYKTGKQADEKVSRVACSKKQVAIGMPVRNAPYYDKNVYSRPVGANGWETNEGKYAAAQVLCLPKRSMRAIKLVKRSAGFTAGARTAKVSATCKGGRAPISWGFESDAMPENTWSGGSNPVMAPLISKATRQGKKGWALTFFTPDGEPAVTQGRVALHLTCAKPR